jgi:hypothetical protein
MLDSRTDPGPIPAFLDRTPVIWNYTMLKTYRDICARQAGKRFIEQVYPYVETAAIVWGRKVHKAFQKRLESQQPLPQDMHQWEIFAKPFDGHMVVCEMNIGVDREFRNCEYYDKSGIIYGRGKADAVVLNHNCTSAYMADWKTGAAREEPFELEVNAVLLKARYPTLQYISGQYIWLKEYRAGRVYDLSNFDLIRSEIDRVYNMILNDRKTGHWPVNESVLCKWCPDTTCPHNKAHEL